jgi:hypothetical protein
VGADAETSLCAGCSWQSLEQPCPGGCGSINWQSRDILLGECKWGAEPVSREVVRELVTVKAPLALKDLPDEGRGWKTHFMLFSRSGFTPAAAEEMQRHGGLLVDLKELDAALAGV